MIIGMKEEKQLREKHYKESKTSNSAKKLDLYIRNNKKQALLVHTNREASLSHLSNVISSRFHVPTSEQVLYYNGERLTPSTHSHQLQIQDKAIIHLVDRRNIRENLTINVRRLNIPRVQQYRIPSSQIIEDFIVRNIQQEERNRMFFVYTGRQLNPRNSFADEFVQNQSELFCLDEEKDEVVGEKRKFYQNKIKQSGKRKGRKEKESTVERLRSERKQQKIQKDSDELDWAQSAIEITQKKQEKQQIKTPNFKKKTMSQQINLRDGSIPQIQIHNNHHQNSISLANDQNFNENKSSLAQGNFFNEGSSISSIIGQEGNNPESSKKLEESGPLFQSAYMGLNNQSVHQALASRPGSIINESQELEIKQQPSITSKYSFSFETRAPELFPTERQLANLGNQLIIEQSKQEYTDSRQLSNEQKGSSENIQGKNEQKQNSKQLSVYQLERVDHHRLNESAEFDVEGFEQNPSAERQNSKLNHILIEQFEREENPAMEYLGVEIEPIAYNNQPSTSKQSQSISQQMNSQNDEIFPKNVDQIDISQKDLITPQFHQQNEAIDVFFIQQEDLAPPTNSQMVFQKQQCQTNGGKNSSSNFYSSNSSRAKFDSNNQYNFGQFEKNNRYRFSGFQEMNTIGHGSAVEHQSEVKPQVKQFTQNQQFLDTPLDCRSRRKSSSSDRDHSMNAVELPMEARIKQNSALLMDYESKYDFNTNELERDKIPKTNTGDNLMRQNSGIDELKELLNEKENEKMNGNALNNLILEKESEQFSQNLIINQQHGRNVNLEEVIDTSLNFRMSQMSNIQKEGASSPLIIKGIKGMLESSESLERMQVKNSLPYLNSYTRSISSDFRFTPHKEAYNIGDFVFNCEVNSFDPLSYFIDIINQEESLQIYKSFP